MGSVKDRQRIHATAEELHRSMKAVRDSCTRPALAYLYPYQPNHLHSNMSSTSRGSSKQEQDLHYRFHLRKSHATIHDLSHTIRTLHPIHIRQAAPALQPHQLARHAVSWQLLAPAAMLVAPWPKSFRDRAGSYTAVHQALKR